MIDVCFNQIGDHEISYSDRVDLGDHYERMKRNMLDTYQKSKRNYDESLSHNQRTTQTNTKQRLEKRSKEQVKEEKQINTVDPLSNLSTILHSLDHANQIGNHDTLSSNLQLPPQSLRWADDRNNYRQESSDLLSRHEKHQTELIETLEQQMNERKKKLQAKLQAMTQARESYNGKEKKDLVERDDEEIERLQTLQKRYDEFFHFLRCSNPSDLEKIGLNELLKRMDQPVSQSMSESLTDVDPDVDSESIRIAAKLSADYKRSRHHEYQEDKEAIEEEAKKISTLYREVQQKHDIAMRLEQARQKQILQGKLLQRKLTGTGNN